MKNELILKMLTYFLNKKIAKKVTNQIINKFHFT
jgi:hypothetical protein